MMFVAASVCDSFPWLDACVCQTLATVSFLCAFMFPRDVCAAILLLLAPFLFV